MKKNLTLLILLCLIVSQFAIACTTFLINDNGQLIFGRNYDWVSAAGMVCTNQRGLNKTSLREGDSKTIHWISKYGSITFNQYGKEFPTGGMNEAGLVVELMWASGTQYPKPDERPAIGVLQWIQYQLDNHATVDAVIASDANIRISPDNPPLHYLVADASGHAATIEFYEGKAVVHTGEDLPLPVLTNSPYKDSKQTATGANILAGDTSFSFQDNSLQRFTTACSMIERYKIQTNKKPVIDYAFEILDKVSQPGFTKWSIVYDLKNKIVQFKTNGYTNIKSVDFNAFDFACSVPPKSIDMNQPMRGNIEQEFKPLSTGLNRKIMEQAIEESKSQVSISNDMKDASIAYANNIKCK